jgi:branched-subunit amino acid ABC-type transport system permease component
VQEFISAVVTGASVGCIYALLAIGLVLTYKTSGVFNLAYGAQAFVSAAVFYDMRVRHDQSIPLAFFVSVVVVAPLVGLILDRLLFRFLRNAPSLAKLVTSLGLLVAIPEIVKLWFGKNAAFGATGVITDGDHAYNPFGEVFVSRDKLAAMVATALVVLALTFIFRYTALGLRMRAVVESGRMTELAGVNSDLVSMTSWMMSSFLAGLAGVLLSPLFAQVSDINYTTLVLAAISAAVLAQLTSIPLACAGGLALGIVQQLLSRYLPTGSILASGIRPALPFIALFLVLILSPNLRNRRELGDPLAGVDPPPPAFAAAERGKALTWGTRIFGLLVGLVVGYYVFFHASPRWVDIAIRATILSTIFLSITVITGMAGQISLCQAAFAGIGACTTAQLATKQDMSVLMAMIVGAVIAAAVGALLAIPALRLGGIFLSLATFAFALFFENVMVKFEWVGGGVLPIRAPRPTIGNIDFANNKSFLVLCLVVLTIVSVVVILVRNGTTGRYLDALRGSEVAAASIGINPNRARIVAFALSAAIAGIGGGLLSMYEQAANYNPNFVYYQSLVWVVLVVTLGARTVEGAIQAGVFFFVFREVVLNQIIPWLVNNVIDPLTSIVGLDLSMDRPPTTLAFILFGLGAVTYARHPEGILEANKRASLTKIQRLIDRVGARRRPPTAAPPAAPHPTATAPEPASGRV